MAWFGALQKSTAMLAWSVAVLLSLFLVLCNEACSGELFLLCRRTGLVIEVLTTFCVARSIGRLLDHDSLVKHLLLVKDGDLIALARYMIRTRGRETVRVTKVKGHAEDVDVQQGRVRLADQQGNSEADTAAD